MEYFMNILLPIYVNELLPKGIPIKKARISPGPLAIANLQGIILKNIC